MAAKNDYVITIRYYEETEGWAVTVTHKRLQGGKQGPVGSSSLHGTFGVGEAIS